MSTQYTEMLKAWWRHLEFPNSIFHISNIPNSLSRNQMLYLPLTMASTLLPDKMKIIFIVLSINKKCVSVLSTLETESSAVHIAHKGRKLLFFIFLFDPCFDSGSAAKTTWLGTRRRRTPTSTTPQRGWRGPGWSRHPFQVSLFCSHSVSWSDFTGEEEEELASRVAPSRKERWVLNCVYKECHNEQGERT